MGAFLEEHEESTVPCEVWGEATLGTERVEEKVLIWKKFSFSLRDILTKSMSFAEQVGQASLDKA